MIPSTVVGTYEGTGAAINVLLGFKPDFILLANAEDGDVVSVWFRGMAADTAIDIAPAGAANATNAADGITAYEGTDGEGFSVGTDYSESGKTFRYFAARSGPGAS